MPVVKINTAADLAAKKKENGGDTQPPVKYKLSAFDVPIDTFSQGDEVNNETAEAIDAAIAYMAELATETNRDLAKKEILESEFDTIPDELKAAQILKASVSSNRICEDCGTFVSEELMFCPECGAFMGITETEQGNATENEQIYTAATEEDKFSDTSENPTVKICPNCSAEIESDLIFCPECGSFSE